MELVVQAEEGTGADLYRWLTADSGIPPDAVITPGDAGDGGTMGTGFDVLNMIISNSIALGSLITSIAAFRDQRRDATGVAPRITVGHANTVVLIDHDGADALRRLTEPHDPPGSPEPPGPL